MSCHFCIVGTDCCIVECPVSVTFVSGVQISESLYVPLADDALDPVHKVWHLGVDAELSLAAAALAEGGHSEDGPATAVVLA